MRRCFPGLKSHPKDRRRGDRTCDPTPVLRVHRQDLQRSTLTTLSGNVCLISEFISILYCKMTIFVSGVKCTPTAKRRINEKTKIVARSKIQKLYNDIHVVLLYMH